MHRPTDMVVAACAATLLAGCNMVMTEKPMFTAADGAGAAPIRSGVWRGDTPGCDVDESLPQDKWPKCADASPGVADPPYWLQVAGKPNLLQLPMPLPKNGAIGISYLYAAYRPLKRDPKGRVIVMKLWAVQCGPPPKPDSADSPAAGSSGSAKSSDSAGSAGGAGGQLTGVTTSPLPGLKMTGDLGGCDAESAAAVRNAASASEAWGGPATTSHWVRDPIPGDKPLLSQSSVLEAMKAAN